MRETQACSDALTTALTFTGLSLQGSNAVAQVLCRVRDINTSACRWGRWSWRGHKGNDERSTEVAPVDHHQADAPDFSDQKAVAAVVDESRADEWLKDH